jgi:hypothetical protein
MRITTKRIRVIEMTEEEIAKFHELMESAKQGREVNYAEERMADGSFLGVSVVKAQAPQESRNNRNRQPIDY